MKPSCLSVSQSRLCAVISGKYKEKIGSRHVLPNQRHLWPRVKSSENRRSSRHERKPLNTKKKELYLFINIADSRLKISLIRVRDEEGGERKGKGFDAYSIFYSYTLINFCSFFLSNDSSQFLALFIRLVRLLVRGRSCPIHR